MPPLFSLSSSSLLLLISPLPLSYSFSPLLPLLASERPTSPLENSRRAMSPYEHRALSPTQDFRRYGYENVKITSLENGTGSHSRRIVSVFDQRVASPTSQSPASSSPAHSDVEIPVSYHHPPSHLHHSLSQPHTHIPLPNHHQSPSPNMSGRTRTKSTPGKRMNSDTKLYKKSSNHVERRRLNFDPTDKRRISSPEGRMAVQMMQRYFPVSSPEEPSSPDDTGAMVSYVMSALSRPSKVYD